MKAYEYQLLRCLPDRVSGEFVNVGLVLLQSSVDPAEPRFLRAGFLRGVSRVTGFFPGLDGRNLQRRLRHLQAMLDGLANELTINWAALRFEDGQSLNLTAVTSRFLVKDDTTIQFSEVKAGLDDDLNVAFEELYERLVENYAPELSRTVRNDYEVWQKLYRPFFEKRGITSRLQHHQVKTANDTIDFSYAWKNEVWHCYEPVSFDLKKPDSVKNKVYKWVGRLDELKSAEEVLEIQLLTALPTNDPDLMAFILEKLDQKVFGSARVSIVRQDEAEQLARQLQEEIIEHEQ